MLGATDNTIRFCQHMDGRDAVCMNIGFLGGSLSCWLRHASLLWQSTQGFLRRVFRLCFDACVFAQPCFVFSMKLGTCVINFMLLNILVRKLYRHFWVRKLVGHSVFDYIDWKIWYRYRATMSCMINICPAALYQWTDASSVCVLPRSWVV
jgi:hypothetical protein